jgi:uncharacterized protein
MAISDLQTLLAGMEPVLYPDRYGFACLDAALSLPGEVVPFAMVAEAEGLTVVAPEAELAAAGLAFLGGWARISLTVQSDLAAVGLTAAIAGALAEVGISANVIAGYHHDHFFVQSARADEAMAVLRLLSSARD